MDISAAGLDMIREREGCRLEAYRDSRNQWTIGVGHCTGSIRFNPPKITLATAEQLLHDDLAPIIAAINALKVQLVPCEFDALCSLIFNIGLGAFEKSTVRRMLLAGNLNAAAHAILLWNEPPEIRARRMGEFVQFAHGEYVARLEENIA